MRPLRASVLGILLLAVGANVWAQGAAQISGLVRDESGAVLPGVTVTVTQTDTGFTRTVVTNEDGAYSMPNLVTGPYRLEAQLQGFRTFTRTGIVLQVGASPVLNVELAIGGLEESVTVEAATPLVDVRSAGVSEVVEQERIVELPLQGRQVTDLIVLAGAAVNTGPVTNTRGRSDSVAISVAGGLRTGVSFTLDGALHNDVYDNGNLAFPFPDALQEFQVATGGLSAESGMHSGASVNAVTKSGTNRFSGSAFEFARHHRFNAPSNFAAVGPDGKRANDGLVRNQFGGTFGGPIISDKLFFFGGYQGTLAEQATADNIAWVPTAAMLNGDFTERTSPACNAGRQIALRAPFVNNRVDPSLVSPISKAIAKFLPTPTNGCGEVKYTAPIKQNNPQAVARLDFQLSPSQTLFGRYLVTAENTPSTFEENGNVLTVQGRWNRRTYREHSTVVGHTAVLSSSKVNSLRVTLTQGGNHLNDPAVQFFDPQSLGIPVYSYVPGSMGMNVTDGFGFATGVAVKVVISKSSYQIDDQYHLDQRGAPVWSRSDIVVLGGRECGLCRLERDVQLPGPADGHGPRGLRRRRARSPRSWRAQHARHESAVPRRLWPGFMAADEPRDPERRGALGTVLRAEHAERRGLEFLARELPQRHRIAGVHERAQRHALPWRSGGQHQGDQDPVVEHLASRRDRVGCGRRRPHGGSILVCHEL